MMILLYVYFYKIREYKWKVETIASGRAADTSVFHICNKNSPLETDMAQFGHYK